MLTARGYWVVSLAAGLVAVWLLAPVAGWVVSTRLGYSDQSALPPTVALLGVSLLFWAGAEWAVFARRVRAVEAATVTRTLLQAGRPVPVVRAGVPFTVRVEVTAAARVPLVFAADLRPTDLPPGVDATGVLALRPGEPAAFEYDAAAAGPGVLRFEGVEMRVVDLAGLFVRRVVLRDGREVPALPPVAQAGDAARTVKRGNALPPPGRHRLKRPGSGDELLDLRDYRPGDEPKMIAWKASARRDSLIIREIETDVPVRCVVFADVSEQARTGPPGETTAARLALHAAAVARAASAARDLVGLTTFDDHGFAVTLPARTRRHQTDLLLALTRAAGVPAAAPHLSPDAAGRHALAAAERLYPDLLAAERNTLPFGLFWRPIADSRKLWVVLFLLGTPGLLMLMYRRELVEALSELASALTRDYSWALLLAVALLPGALAGMVWLSHGAAGLLPHNARRTRARKRLGLLFAHLQGGGPAAVERVVHDDDELVSRARAFLATHRVRVPGPAARADAPGGKLKHLAAGVARAVGSARDNELYVVFADLLADDADLSPLADAVTVARARRHQVLVLVPGDPAGVTATPALIDGRLTVASIVARADAGRGVARWAEVRAKLTKAGASVVLVKDTDPARLVLDRLNRVRGRGVRR